MPHFGEATGAPEKKGTSISVDQVGFNMRIGVTESDGFYFEGVVTDSKPDVFVVTDKYDSNRTRVYKRTNNDGTPNSLSIVQF